MQFAHQHRCAVDATTKQGRGIPVGNVSAAAILRACVRYRQSSYTSRAAAETTIGAPYRHITFIIILIQPTQVGGEDLFLAPPPTFK